MSLTWFGFGFNGFGQIEECSEKTGKACTPVRLQNTNACRVRASWSRRADVHLTNCGSHVRVSGFEYGSSAQKVPESQGCTDALITERFLLLGFTDRVECWESSRLVWTRGHEVSSVTADPGVALPLVPGGCVLPRPPFFRPLCPTLRAASLALGSDHAVLLTATGAVFSWGSGSHGQLGHGALTSQEEPQVLEALWGVPVRAVSAGGWHSAAVSAAGDLYMWGWNESGQLGLPSRRLQEDAISARSTEDNKEPENVESESQADVFISVQAFPALVDIPDVTEIRSVSCGSRHTASVSGEGHLYTWGWGEYGQLGHGSNSSSDQPRLVLHFSSRGMTVQDVTCGAWSTFVCAASESKEPTEPRGGEPQFIPLEHKHSTELRQTSARGKSAASQHDLEGTVTHSSASTPDEDARPQPLLT